MASGQAGIDECVPLNNGQFALGQDDEGHIGGGSTEAWAISDPMLKVHADGRQQVARLPALAKIVLAGAVR